MIPEFSLDEIGIKIRTLSRNDLFNWKSFRVTEEVNSILSKTIGHNSSNTDVYDVFLTQSNETLEY